MIILCPVAVIMANESTDSLAEKVRYIEDSSFEQPDPDPESPQCGFDCQFIENPPEDLQSHCPVCRLVLREPYVVDCCGQRFCRACIKRIEADEKPCPTCNKADFSAISDKRLQRSLYALGVRCSHEKEGCQWTGKLGELDKHLNENPSPDEQPVGCEFVEIGCVHCSALFLRPNITAHQNEECRLRPFSCIYCRSYESSYEGIVNDHWQVCDSYPVSCPNQCGEEPERQNLEHHVSKDCPLTVVNCDFHYAGCEVQLPRKDMPAHLAENLVIHMSLLATQSQKLEVQHEEMDQQSQKISKENVKLKEELAHFRQKLEVQRKEMDQQRWQGRKDLGVAGIGGVISVVGVLALAIIWVQVCPTTDKPQAEATDLASIRQEMEQLERQLEQKLPQATDLASIRQEMEQLKRQLEQKIEKLPQATDLASIRQEIEQLKRQLEHEIEELRKLDLSEQARKNEIEQLKTDLKMYIKQEMEAHKIKMSGKNGSKILDELSITAPQIVPAELIMTHFEKHKKNREKYWFSAPFYSHPAGYKLCLSVTANGHGSGKDTHVTVSVHLMRGEFDDDLKWPFRGDITIQLLNQLQDEGHHEKTINFNNTLPNRATGRVITGDQAAGWGIEQFILHGELKFNCTHRYLKYDSLRFRVTNIELKIDIVPFHIIMTDFDKRAADVWYSDPFFTHPQGYRMCLGVKVKDRSGLVVVGNLPPRRDSVSIIIYILQGEYDSCLVWPFQGIVTVQLLNPVDNKKHTEQTIHFTDKGSSGDEFVLDATERKEKVKRYETSEFDIPYEEIKRKFVTSGSVHFEVTEVKISESSKGRSLKCLYLFC